MLDSSWVMPSTAFIGVRISWLMLATNSLFARLATSALSMALRSCCAASFSRLMSLAMPRKPTISSAELRTAVTVSCTGSREPSLRT
ncbi:hypothetical protein D3C85_1677250 [compost metagenome]